MAEVEVTITVNDEGVVQSIRAGGEEFKRLEEQVEGAAEAGDDFASTQSQVADAARQSGDGAAQAASQMSAYEKALQALNQRGIKTTDQLKEERQELQRHQKQFPKNSRAARALQAEIDRLSNTIGQKSVQEIRRQIQALEQLESSMREIAQGADQVPKGALLTSNLSNVEEAKEAFELVGDEMVDVSGTVEKLQSKISDLNDELRETQTPDTQITAYEQAVRDLNDAGVVTSEQLEDMRDELEILQGVFEDDERVVRELQKQINNLNDEIDRQGRAAEGASEEMDEQASTLQRLNNLGIQTKDQLVDQVEELRQLQNELEDGSRAYNKLEDRIVQLNEKIERSGQKTAEFGRQTAKSRQFIFSAGDAVQDLRFGVAGAGNNIAFMAEQLSEMSATATSATDVLRTMQTAILGPAGLILALQAVIGLGPVVANKLKEMELGADELSLSVEDATESFDEMLNLLGETRQEFSVSRLVASELSDELSAVSEEISSTFSQRLQQLMGEIEMFNDQFNPAIFEDYRRQLRQVLADNEELQQALEEVGIPMELLMRQSRLTEQEMQQLSQAFQENKNAVNNLEAITKGAQQSLKDLVESSREAELQQRRFTRAIEEGLTAQELYADTQKQLTDLTEDLRGQMELGLIDEQEALERQAALIEEVLQLAAGTDLADTQAIEDLRQQWESLNETLEDTESSAEESTSALTESLEEFIQLQEQLEFEEEIGIGTELERTERKAEFLRETLKDLGPDVDRSSEAFQFLVDKLEQYSQEVENLEGEGALLETLREDFLELQRSLSREVTLGTKDQLEAAQEEVRFLEDALQQVAESDLDMSLKGVQQLQNQLSTARGIVSAYEGEVEEALGTMGLFEKRFLTGSDAAENFKNHVAGMSNEVEGLAGTDKVLAAFQEEINGVRRIMEEVSGTDMSPRTAKLQNALSQIEKMRENLRRMRREGEKNEEEFRHLMGVLDELEAAAQGQTDVIESWSEAGDKLGDVFSQQMATDTLTRGFTELGRAIVESESAMEALRKTALSVLADIAKAIGKKLIAMGTATLLENPAKGAAMIAAGGTLLTLAGAMSAQSRGGGRAESGQGATSQASAQDQSVQRDVPVPGRRTGGPVEAGEPYTVGEGETEMFIPGQSGMVLPQSAIQSPGRNPAPQNVRVESKVDGQIGLDETVERFGLRMREMIQQAEAEVTEST